jgi:hypothetical protein
MLPALERHLEYTHENPLEVGPLPVVAASLDAVPVDAVRVVAYRSCQPGRRN